jgi:hypothetical protein
MGINHENLDEKTRSYMLKEIALGNHYISPRLTDAGKVQWATPIESAAMTFNDNWLANQLLAGNFLKTEESYTRSGKVYSRRINQPNAAEQLSEGEFNRFYLRGLALRAIEEGKDSLQVYRGKAVAHPREESEAKIGTKVSAQLVLETLRTNDFVTIDHALGVPGGSNSGLTARLI